MRLRGKVVFVEEAKYRRASDAKDSRRVQVGGDMRNGIIHQPQQERQNALLHPASGSKDARRDKEIQVPHGIGSTKKLEVAVAKENLDWLQKSQIGRTTKAIILTSVP
ncbi:hypothetical protein AHAS_Ahas06G0156500 [Arachis hypogaea]